MAPILIVLALLALGVGVVAWMTRRRPSRPYEQRREQDTAWNDPLTPRPEDRPPPPEDRP